MRMKMMIAVLLAAPAVAAQQPVGMFADVEGGCVVQGVQDTPCGIGRTLASGQMVEVADGGAATIVLDSGATYELAGESVVEVYADGVFVISGALPMQSAERWAAAPAVIASGLRFEVAAVRMRGPGEAPADGPLPEAPDEDARFTSRLMYALTLLHHGEDEEALAWLRLLSEERPDADFIRRVLAGYDE